MMPHQTTQAQSNSLIAAKKPVFVSTWNFGKPANEASLRRYNEGGSLLDAVEEGIRLTEADTSNASVGAGGGKLDVVSEGGMILAGASVKVVEADGVRIVVRQID